MSQAETQYTEPTSQRGEALLTGQPQPPAVNIEAIRYLGTVSVPVAGAVLGIGRGASYEAAKNGTLPTIRVGRRLRVPVQPLLRLIGADQPRFDDQASGTSPDFLGDQSNSTDALTSAITGAVR